jgi:hypothetical protein
MPGIEPIGGRQHGLAHQAAGEVVAPHAARAGVGIAHDGSGGKSGVDFTPAARGCGAGRSIIGR